jgi:NAD(P)-dependent dehydrogenase (short-subunit alcohol dehydrogenase family)
MSTIHFFYAMRGQELAEACVKEGRLGKLISYRCDLSSESEIEGMFQWIRKNHEGIDVLVNNAGCGTMTPLLRESTFHYILDGKFLLINWMVLNECVVFCKDC